MKIIDSLSNFKTDKQTVVTIGTFDGVHLGHQELLHKLVQEAKATNCYSVVLTFFPHPRMVLQQNTGLKFITTSTEKAKLLEEIGIDYLVIHPFSIDFSRLSAEEFVEDVLVKTLHIKKIIIGYDHRFGRNRTASVEDLIVFGEQNNFSVEQIEAKEINEISISSTKIRKAIESGDMQLAKKYLGRNFEITGKVVAGNQIGRTINFPTANVEIEEAYKLIPKNGVYFVSIQIEATHLYGMLNIGTNPTVNNETQTIEVHIFDFNETIYNKQVKISFLQFIREEKKFDSLIELQKQLEIDQLFCFELIENEKKNN